MIFLAIDTSENSCAICLYDSLAEKEKARKVLSIEKGHSEYLIDLFQEACKEAQIDYAEIGAVGVAVGPGSFTGIRVGVSFARALSLALGIPAIGVNLFEALRETMRMQKIVEPMCVVLETSRKEHQCVMFDAQGLSLDEPSILRLEDIIALCKTHNALLIGSSSSLEEENMDFFYKSRTADIGIYAQLAVKKFSASYDGKPRPLYLSSPVRM